MPAPAPREIATASPQSAHDAGHRRFHQDGLCLEQLEKSGYSLYFSSACGVTGTGTRNQPLCIISPVGPMHALYPELSVGGVNLLCQKSKWVVFGFLFLFFTFPILKKKQTNKKESPPRPFVFLLSGYCFKCIFCLLLGSFGFGSTSEVLV